MLLLTPSSVPGYLERLPSRGFIAPSVTMEGFPYINSRTVYGLVAKALSTKAADVHPDLFSFFFLWALVTDVPCTIGIHLHL